MSVTHDEGQGTRPPHKLLEARVTGAVGDRAPIIRKPVKKTYGKSTNPQHAYTEGKYERERRLRREAGSRA